MKDSVTPHQCRCAIPAPRDTTSRDPFAVHAPPSPAMSHLRLVPTPPPLATPTADDGCLDAFQREVAYVLRTLYRLGVPGHEVEDLAQDVFLALRSTWTEFDPKRPLRAYLFGIAFRIACNHNRRRRRELISQSIELFDSGPSPEDEFQAKQARKLVLAALDHIPLPRRAVLVMYELDQISMHEVASVLSIPLFTAYSRLRKARRELRHHLRRAIRARTAQ